MRRIGKLNRLGIGASPAYLIGAMLVLIPAGAMIGIIAATGRSAPLAGAESSLPSAPVSVYPVIGGAARFLPGHTPSLDRIVAAVDAAESNYGTNPRMIRTDPDGPQGPMQLTAAAAADIGGGNRFDLRENLALGRAYLAHMFHHYGSWADAVAAYNWGPGHMDSWIHGGRRADRLPAAVARYTGQVLLASASPGVQLPDPNVKALSLVRRRPGLPPQTQETPRRKGIAGSDGTLIPAGAGGIGTPPPARLSHSRGKGHDKGIPAHSHISSLRRPRGQIRDTLQAKASRSKSIGSFPRRRKTLPHRVAVIEGSRFIPAHRLRALKARPRQYAARIASRSIPTGGKNAKMRKVLSRRLAVHPGSRSGHASARTDRKPVQRMS